jgi:hypothetical protein
MPSPTDFNLSPYYDDFAESKKFHRILFRPAFAVQARELTQSQTILQNQIEKLGDHFFEKGAMVIPGEIGYDLNYYAVKLTSIDSTNTLSNFTDGTTLTGSTSGITATIVIELQQTVLILIPYMLNIVNQVVQTKTFLHLVMVKQLQEQIVNQLLYQLL